MAAPKRPSDLRNKSYLRFVDPTDDEKVIQIDLIDTGKTSPDTIPIYALGVAGPYGPIPVLPAALIVNPPITLAGGGAEQLPAKALINGINMKAKGSNNVAGVWFGADNTVAIGNGYPLFPGSGLPIEVQNMDAIWVYGTAGDVLFYNGG